MMNDIMNLSVSVSGSISSCWFGTFDLWLILIDLKLILSFVGDVG